jgi:predicted N-acetyltransferase YhbS
VTSQSRPTITYRADRKPTVAEYVNLLNRSTMDQRRPVDDLHRIQSMLDHANLVCTAWSGNLLVGVARSLTDFAYCCYLADLSVDHVWQRQGIGKELIRQTRQQLHPKAKIVLISAPAAVDYYPHIGFTPHDSAWVLPDDQ